MQGTAHPVVLPSVPSAVTDACGRATEGQGWLWGVESQSLSHTHHGRAKPGTRCDSSHTHTYMISLTPGTGLIRHPLLRAADIFNLIQIQNLRCADTFISHIAVSQITTPRNIYFRYTWNIFFSDFWNASSSRFVYVYLYSHTYKINMKGGSMIVLDIYILVSLML